MQGLEADMAAGAHGLWIEDRAIVEAAARRIAEHPRVTPEQMSIIQATLGEGFAAFARHDRDVHDAAVAFAEAEVADLLARRMSGSRRGACPVTPPSAPAFPER